MLSDLKEYCKLTDRKKRAVELRAIGSKTDFIAKETGYSPVTLGIYFSAGGRLNGALKEYRNFLMEQRGKLVVKMEARVAEDVKLAWVNLVKLSEDEKVPVSVRLQALDSILDRGGQPRGSRSESRNEHEFKGKTVEERQERYADVIKLWDQRKAG